MKSSLFPYIYDFHGTSLLVENAGVVGVRDPSVPQQRELLAFLQRMHQSTARDDEAGRFLHAGVMERPLALPVLPLSGFAQDLVTTTTNPSVAPFQRNDFFQGVTQHFYEDPFTASIPYAVANVLHSVWRASPLANELGIVFVNWSDDEADWQGTFDPGLYRGFAGKFAVWGLRPAGGGVERYAIGTGEGKTVLGFHAAGSGLLLRPHAAAAAGPLPPRSVQVILIEPRR
jgi:hypothetical protein